MAKRIEVGGQLTLELDVTRYKDGLVTVQFRDGTKVTIRDDSSEIVGATPEPKIDARRSIKSGPGPLDNL